MRKESKYHVYILYSPSHKRYYTGQTSDLGKRFTEHNSGEAQATKYGLPWKLVWTRAVGNQRESVNLERKIKQRGAKRFMEDESKR